LAETPTEETVVLDLGTVHLERSNAPLLLTTDEPLPPDADLYFSAALDRLGAAGGLPRFLLAATGGAPRDAGLFAVGLARVAAARGMDVLLADLSVDSPVLARPFPYQAEEGVTDMILWGASFQAVQRRTRHEKIRVVCVGSPPPDPERLFEEPECDAVLNTLRGESELVVAVGPLRTASGALSPLLRKADRVLIVREEGEELPDLRRTLSEDRLAAAAVAAETREARSAAPASRAGARGDARKEKERMERKRIPVGRIAAVFAALSIVLGIVIAGIYLRMREGSEGERGLAARPAASAPPVLGRAETPGAETRFEVAREEAPAEGGDVAAGLPAAVPAGDAGEPVPRAEGEEEGALPGGTTVERLAAGAPEDVPETPSEESASPRAEAPIPAPPAAVREEAAPSPGAPLYAVHVESFPTREDAERGARQYRESGEIVTIIEKEIPEKGIWYRVLLGRFPSKEDAAAHAEEAKETYGLSYALVVRTSP